MPKISFIMSAYDRPKHLRCALASLQIQTEPDIEVIVADNGTNDFTAHVQDMMVRQFLDERFHYRNPRARTCYEATKVIAPETKGEWLCFPHDDGWYAPEFAEAMLRGARQSKADFIYCDMLYDSRMFGHYDVLRTQPRLNQIDKGGFIVKRSWFDKVDWPPAPNDMCRDGLLVDALVRLGIRTHKVAGILWCHN